jgi:hypothetical protein
VWAFLHSVFLNPTIFFVAKKVLHGIPMSDALSSPIKRRTRTPEKWNVHSRKVLAQTGKAYTNSRGKQIAARSIQPHEGCRFSCYQNVDLPNRQRLFQEYWSKTQEQQTEFLLGCRKTVENPDGRKRKVRNYNIYQCHFSVMFFNTLLGLTA